jgi:hypothetical protein
LNYWYALLAMTPPSSSPHHPICHFFLYELWIFLLDNGKNFELCFKNSIYLVPVEGMCPRNNLCLIIVGYMSLKRSDEVLPRLNNRLI